VVERGEIMMDVFAYVAAEQARGDAGLPLEVPF
jgi:hypothetical protein